MKKLNVDPFAVYGRDWALVTAGDMNRFNTMTISWGGMGTLWGKSVVTVYIKPIRYTYEFMEAGELFTVSFYPPEYRKDLDVLGTLSGRDGDKVAKTALTPIPCGGAVTFREAHTTLLCRKLYSQDLDPARIPEEAMRVFYKNEPPHRMYIAEVLDIL